MSENDLFQSDDTEFSLDPEKKYSEELIGDGKRYSDQEKAARALVEKDNFIEQLKRENAQMRESMSKRMNEEDFLKKLEEVASRGQPAPNGGEPPVEGNDKPAALKPEDVEAIIAKREIEARQKQNLDSVLNKLQETFGADYRRRVQDQARTMGVDTSFLTDVAKKNPQAFYRLMGLDQKEQRNDAFSPPPRSTASTPMTGGSKKDYAYFQRLRAEKGESWYFSIPVQQEVWKAAKEAEARGESFLPTQ